MSGYILKLENGTSASHCIRRTSTQTTADDHDHARASAHTRSIRHFPRSVHVCDGVFVVAVAVVVATVFCCFRDYRDFVGDFLLERRRCYICSIYDAQCVRNFETERRVRIKRYHYSIRCAY